MKKSVKENVGEAEAHVPERQPHRVRLPGWVIEEEIGLGDLIKKTTYAMGIKPCSGCEKRATGLNRWMHLTR